jgi:hypothetical protein
MIRFTNWAEHTADAVTALLLGGLLAGAVGFFAL